LVILALVAILVVAGATVGIVQARAQNEPLASVTPAQLLAKILAQTVGSEPVSGDVTWMNSIVAPSIMFSGVGGSGDLSALFSSGSGRLWLQDKKARFEIQGATADTTAVAAGGTLWVYSSRTNTATEYALPEQVDPESLVGALSPGQNPPSAGGAQVTLGPTIVQRYGQGFGTVLLAEAKVLAELATELKTMLQGVPLVSRGTQAGFPTYALNSAPGAVVLWSKDGHLFVATGSVPQTDLMEFVTSVH
jgi:hypothetical protein